MKISEIVEKDVPVIHCKSCDRHFTVNAIIADEGEDGKGNGKIRYWPFTQLPIDIKNNNLCPDKNSYCFYCGAKLSDKDYK